MNDTEPVCNPSEAAPASGDQHDSQPERHESCGSDGDAEHPDRPKDPAQQPREIGGRKGPDPVRYGDWEKNGRCIDF